MHRRSIWRGTHAFDVIGDVPTDYRLAAPVVVRMMGATVVLGGLFVVLSAITVALLSLPGSVISTVVGVVAALVVLTLAAVFVLARRRAVVRLDETGYRVGWVRGAGVTEGRWTDVEEAAAATVDGQRCLVLQRRDGRTTTIPVDILDRPGERFVQDVQQHLNRGHGYRPLR